MKAFNIFRFFSTKNYYEILEISPTATSKEIKSAYLNLAKKYHPDSQEGNEDLFKLIGEAYSILKNEEQKETYDKTLKKPEKVKKKGKPEGAKNFTSENFKKLYEFKGGNWSGNKFTEKESTKHSDPNIKPGDVFLKMGGFALAGCAVFFCGYIGVLIMQPAPAGRERIERPEGIVAKMPERKPAK